MAFEPGIRFGLALQGGGLLADYDRSKQQQRQFAQQQERQAREDAYIQQQRQIAEQQRKKILGDDRAKAAGTDLLSVKRLLTNNRPDKAMELLSSRVGLIGDDGDATESMQLAQAITQAAQGGQGFGGIIQGIDEDIGILQDRGILSRPEAESFTLSPGQTRFSGGQVVASAPESEKQSLTSIQKNLIATGLKEGTPEFQRAVSNQLNKSSAPTVNISNVGETTEQKERAKLRAKRWGDIQDTADKAGSRRALLNQLKNIDVKTGALEPGKVAIASVIEGFGIDASRIANVANAEAYTAVSNTLVNEVLNAASGAQTEDDARRAMKNIANLGDTPKGAEFKINSLLAITHRDEEQSAFYSKVLDGGGSLTEARVGWNKFKKETPSLSAVVKGPGGLPVFFYQFKESSKQRRPGISDAEIVQAWRAVNAKK